MPANCDVNLLAANSRCFLDQCQSEAEREALEIYLGVQNLAGAGGANYTGDLNALLNAAKSWATLSEAQLSAINVYIAQQNAIDNGGDAANASVNTLRAAARCFVCIPTMTRHQLLMFLRCAISEQGVAD